MSEKLKWRYADEECRTGQLVWVRCSCRPEYGAHLMMWDVSLEYWCGYTSTPMKRRKIIWDPMLPQPDQYAVPITP